MSQNYVWRSRSTAGSSNQIHQNADEMSTFLECGEGWRDDSYAGGVSGAVKDGVDVND
jgi:hypothetical protein